MPLLIRGAFYGGWDPSRTPERMHVQQFLARVAHEAGYAGETEASVAVQAAAKVLRAHVSEGEIADVMAVLPPDVVSLFAE